MFRALKRILRPLRPWLAPVERRWLIAIDTMGSSVDEELEQMQLPDWPIRAIRSREFLAMAKAHPYYLGRWRYMSRALVEATRLITRDRLTSVLEIGTPAEPIILGSHVMDLRVPRGTNVAGTTLHDARVTPWPFADRQFDLLIALQVFEHLRPAQRDAFREIRRISRHAILSLPIGWDMDDPSNVHHQISEEQALSWFTPVVPTRIVQGNGGRRRRMIYVFEDLPA